MGAGGWRYRTDCTLSMIVCPLLVCSLHHPHHKHVHRASCCDVTMAAKSLGGVDLLGCGGG